MAKPKSTHQRSIWDRADRTPRPDRFAAQIEPAEHDEEPRDVCCRSRQRDHHCASVATYLRRHGSAIIFNLQITLWLWFTVLFANFAEAMAEGRGKAQADALRRAKSETMANRLNEKGAIEQVPSSKLCSGNIVIVSAGEMIPGDGEIIDGVASVDESAITGESAPVIRESGGDRSAVTGGTRVLSDQIKIRITSNPGETFIDKMIALVEGAERQKTPNEIALNILLAGLTIIFLLAVVTLQPIAIYSHSPQTVFVLVSLLVCLIPTTIGGLLSAIGIAGMDRLVQHNVLAMSGRAVEAAGDVNTLLLDKTGTITFGNRQATEFLPAPGVSKDQLADAAQLSSLADETPEGRSIVVLAKETYGLRGRDLATMHAEFVPFSATTRMSGINVDGRTIRKGAADSIATYLQASGGILADEVRARCGKDCAQRWHAAGGRGEQSRPGSDPSERHCERRHARTFCSTARHGHPHHYDHGRQPADRSSDRSRSRRGRFSGGSETERQDGPDPSRAKRRQTGRDDGRRHQRCSRAGPGRCGRCDEYGHAGRQRSREHGRSGFQPHQADRDCGNRQTASDDPRRADNIFHRQRCRKILRHHSGNVCRNISSAGRIEYHASANAAVGDSFGSHLQRANYCRADSAGVARREISAR